MKAAGSLLLLLGGLLCRGRILMQKRQVIALGEEFCRNLEVLHRGIFRLQTPMQELFLQCREEGRFSTFFWDTLVEGVAAEEPFIPLWEHCCALLPPLYADLWRPLGGALRMGEREGLLLLTREEMSVIVRESRQLLAEQNKLVTTLCLGCSLLLVILLI